MHPQFLFLLAAILPGVWGWGTHWLLERIWPRRDLMVSHHDVPSRAPVDYQI